jgi:stress response protein SCP2
MLAAGQNVGLTDLPMRVEIVWHGPTDVDLSLLLLGPDSRVRTDADLIFYNHPASPDGTVRYTGPIQQLDPEQRGAGATVELPLIEAAVQRVVVVASAYETDLSRATDLTVTVRATDDSSPWRFSPRIARESALVCVEFYRRDGWRLRAVGQGYEDGLTGLARDFGVDVES